MTPVTALSYRERVLWEVAARYRDLVEPLNGPSDVRGTGELVPLMPRTYTPTVREFERLLVLMRSRAYQEAFRGVGVGTLRWHLVEYHLKSVRVIRHVPVLARNKHGKLVAQRSLDGVVVTRPEIAYLRDPGCREGRARDGVAWVAERWGLEAEPMLPQEVVEWVAA